MTAVNNRRFILYLPIRTSTPCHIIICICLHFICWTTFTTPRNTIIFAGHIFFVHTSFATTYACVHIENRANNSGHIYMRFCIKLPTGPNTCLFRRFAIACICFKPIRSIIPVSTHVQIFIIFISAPILRTAPLGKVCLDTFCMIRIHNATFNFRTITSA